MSVNKVILLGRVIKAIEVKNLPSGSSVANFSVATSERFKDKQTQEWKEKAEFHNVTVFGKTAENCGKYLGKGSQIYVEGRLQTDTYEKDGQKHYSTKIKADSVQFLGQKPNQDDSKSTSDNQENYSISTAPEFATDDIPFSPMD